MTTVTARVHEFAVSKFPATITNHLKTGPSGNSKFSVKINCFLSLIHGYNGTRELPL